MGDPGMLAHGGTDIADLESFYDELFAVYTEVFWGTRNAMFRLKENWGLILPRYPHCEKLGKQLRKTTDLNEYHHISTQIFAAME